MRRSTVPPRSSMSTRSLEPIRELLLQMFMGEKFGRDSIWETHLTAELWQTEVPIGAVLDEVEAKLSDVLNWQVGTKLELTAHPTSEVDLRCGDVVMFQGHMGQRIGKIAVQISRNLCGEEQQD